MSLSTALSNAGTGLTGSSRLADTVSNNVANALSEGFARRTTELSSLALGGYGSGVRVVGTYRAENALATAERRSMDAAAAAAETLGSAYDRVLAAIGEPGTTAALASRANAFETALLGAVASPQSFAKLSTAVEGARALATSLNAISRETAAMRLEADREIGRQVGALNTNLEAVEALNAKIVQGRLQGIDTGALEDERGRAIDRIAAIVPVRTIKRDGGEVALYSQNGATLLDGRAFTLSFETGPAVITADMTLAGGALNTLQQDRGGATGLVDVAVGTGSGAGLLDGGSLSALFEIRDGFTVAVNAEVDLYARDIIERFSALMPPAALDGAGQGLFVDSAPGPMEGLAGRIGLNAAVDPSQGGAVERLRNGLDGTPQPEGFATYLEAMVDAMTALRVPAAGMASTSASNGAAGFAAEIAAFFGAQAARGDEARAYLVGQQAILTERETDIVGVDSDAQLQFLMLIEQAYAANARVLTVVDSLLKQLLEI
jgi:flagellar hook-associated protein 1 FlgK